jgi:tripartite-type tricarboxylate transporter receptor subunit TctC
VGVIAAANLPDAIVNKINDAVNKAANHPEAKAKLVAAGFEVSARDLDAPQLAQAVKAEFERNAAIVKTFDIKLSQ